MRVVKLFGEVSRIYGRAIAQAVSRRIPIAAARVQIRVWSCGNLWWTKVALGQVFSENFGFPCQSTFHLRLHNHLHYHPRLAHNRPGVAAVPIASQPPYTTNNNRCRLATAAARVQTRVWSCGILWWTKVALGQIYSENFGFPCQSTFHLRLHNHLHYHPRVA
jgi:uncharacterized protein YaiE (UPF0345 family)